MRLKKLKLFGFKSFADKTEVHFHKGMTGIVGPNGCGKSNIADAIRWVMGEQSAKSMRGNRMPDIIFAGTAKRKALGICEVAITFTNDQGVLPIDYEEVEVTRRLHRSGDSEYFINGQHVRLKDIQDLFLDTGVGKNSFAIFEQGKIDQVINFSPTERRTIFEDAAGILRFLVEKQRAMRKLEHVDNNMSRVQDIHQEVERQIVIKEKQVEKAKAYKSNRAEFEELEKGVFLTRWDRFEKKRSVLGEKEAENQQQLTEKGDNLKQLVEEVAAKKELLNKNEARLREQNENVYKTRSEREIKQRESQNNQVRLQEIAEKEKKWEADLAALKETRQSRESEKAALAQQQEEVESKLAGLEQVTKEQWEQVCAIEHDLVELRKEQQQAHHQYVTLIESEKKIDSEIKQHTVRLEHNHERQNQLKEKKAQLQSYLEELSEQITAKEQAVREVSQDIDDQKHQLESFQEKLKTLKEQIRSTKDEIEVLRKQKAEAEARQKVLKRMREEMEGFSKGTKRLLQESGQEGSAIHNKVKGLYELITPKAGSEEAVSGVMKPYTQTVVTETEADFRAVLEYAKEHQIKDYSILCLEQLEQNADTTEYTSLLTKVLDSAVSRHFLNGVAVANDAVEALQLVKSHPHLEVWTNDGKYVDGKRVLFHVTQGQNNAFMREAELKALESSLAELNSQFEQKEAALAAMNEEHDNVDGQRLELDRHIRQEEMKLVEVNFAFQRAKGDRDKTQTESEKINLEIAAAGEAIERHQKILMELSDQHGSAQSDAEQHRERSEELLTKVEELAEQLKGEQERLKEKESHHQGVIEEHRKVIHALNVLEVQDLESVQQQKRLEQEIEAGQSLVQEIQNRMEEDAQQLEEVKKTLQEVEDISSKLEFEVMTSKQAITQMEEALDTARSEIKVFEKQLYEVGIELTQVNSSLEVIGQELQERYAATVEDLREQGVTLEMGTEEAEKRIRKLRRTLDESGDINMASIEEYEELKERYEFLNQQLDDLAVSKQELVEIITKLDAESRKMFEVTFEQVRTNFQKNYSILFNGGEADLRFTEAEDVLDAGIDIVAKPPGKQMRNISLLSGGEKCLTAMALLFAIFEVKTAPFCILDEVDAPLDDSNIARFVNVVKQFTNTCQFVIITHNKRTMAICDRLFGVSMQERGVSRLLSIEFAKDKSPEPALV